MNIYDIAAEAGVSISTVSRVLNNRGRVKKETQEKIEAVLRKYDYQPSAVARGLVTKSMRTIGILTVDIRVMHYANTTYILEQELSHLGYNVMVCSTGGLMSENLRYLRMMVEKQVDGLVLVGSVFEEIAQSAEGVEYLRHMPVVIANGSLALENVYSVLVDDPLGTALSVRHLVQKGHKDIFYVQDLDTHSAQRKVEGFQRAMRESGLPFENRILKCGHGLEAGIAFSQTLLQREKRFTALVFGEDLTAICTMKGLQRSGVRIPDDVAVVGFNDSEYARMCTPELSSIDNKYQLVGEYSVKLLTGLLEGSGTEADIVIRPVLVVRESS